MVVKGGGGGKGGGGKGGGGKGAAGGKGGGGGKGGPMRQKSSGDRKEHLGYAQGAGGNMPKGPKEAMEANGVKGGGGGKGGGSGKGEMEVKERWR